ncbi:MAG: hypothetical protein U1E93_01585 [Alphaproteobacteria bacterium]
MMQASTRAFFRSVGRITMVLLGLIFILSVLSSYVPDGVFFGLILLLLIGGLFLLGFGPVALYAAIKERKWRVLLSLAAALAVTILLTYPVWMMGDYVHLATSYARYRDRFDTAQGAPVSILWSQNGFAGSSCDTFLVYDPSGRGGEGSGPGVITRHLTGHFHIRADCN